MEAVLLLTVSIALLCTLMKFLVSKYLEKEKKSLKSIVKDFIMSAISSFAVLLVYFNYQTSFTDFFSVVTNKSSIQPPMVEVFTGGPEF